MHSSFCKRHWSKGGVRTQGHLADNLHNLYKPRERAAQSVGLSSRPYSCLKIQTQAFVDEREFGQEGYEYSETITKILYLHSPLLRGLTFMCDFEAHVKMTVVVIGAATVITELRWRNFAGAQMAIVAGQRMGGEACPD